MDHQKIRSLIEAIRRTYIHALRVFTIDTVFGNDKGHCSARDRLEPAGRPGCQVRRSVPRFFSILFCNIEMIDIGHLTDSEVTARCLECCEDTSRIRLYNCPCQSSDGSDGRYRVWAGEALRVSIEEKISLYGCQSAALGGSGHDSLHVIVRMASGGISSGCKAFTHDGSFGNGHYRIFPDSVSVVVAQHA